jgi:hypothetical protein
MTEMNQPTERTIILHYHLFKNAGTSVDAILKRNFGDKWVTSEFPPMGGNNTALVEEWIRETPDAIAYSSHTMMGPIPEVEGVRVISFMLLRDPIERIKSVYRFEKTQDAETWGAQLAKRADLNEYINKRLERAGDRQCKDFQSSRLASISREGITELERCFRALDLITVSGTVEKIDLALSRLQHKADLYFKELDFSAVKRNTTIGTAQEDATGQTAKLLYQNNANDYILWKYVNEHGPASKAA